MNTEIQFTLAIIMIAWPIWTCLAMVVRKRPPEQTVGDAHLGAIGLTLLTLILAWGIRLLATNAQ